MPQLLQLQLQIHTVAIICNNTHAVQWAKTYAYRGPLKWGIIATP
jgi:hypothetical protein